MKIIDAFKSTESKKIAFCLNLIPADLKLPLHSILIRRQYSEPSISQVLLRLFNSESIKISNIMLVLCKTSIIIQKIIHNISHKRKSCRQTLHSAFNQIKLNNEKIYLKKCFLLVTSVLTWCSNQKYVKSVSTRPPRQLLPSIANWGIR